MARPFLLDGGMGGELVRRGYDSPNIWSARALIEAPHVVRQVHEEFLDAGADLITTSNYSCTPKILGRAGHGHRVRELVGRARDLANEARAKKGKPGTLVAGSLPPLVGTYTPELVEPVATMREVYGEIAETLAPGVDLIIVESMTTGLEARTAAEAAAKTGKPVWVSYILMDSGTPTVRSGESIADAVKALDGIAKVEAILFNCCSPEAITAGMARLRGATAKKVGGYANAFRPIPDRYEKARDGRRTLREDVTPDAYASAVAHWIKDGADIIGGCCGTGPEHIRRLNALRD
jgi:S-methylmethionine-dependent homocysteine/selenocysteine methylase